MNPPLLVIEEGHGMVAIRFGHLCFDRPSGEQSILIVLAPKKDYSSMYDFVTHALNCPESDPELCDPWNEMYKNRIY